MIYYRSIAEFTRVLFERKPTRRKAMAVSTKTVSTTDNGWNDLDVHYVKVNRNNRKGAAACVGGKLVDETDGDFHIVLKTKVNGEPVNVNVRSGDIVFRTGKNVRWQVKDKAGFLKRFPKLTKI